MDASEAKDAAVISKHICGKSLSKINNALIPLSVSVQSVSGNFLFRYKTVVVKLLIFKKTDVEINCPEAVKDYLTSSETEIAILTLFRRNIIDKDMTTSLLTIYDYVIREDVDDVLDNKACAVMVNKGKQIDEYLENIMCRYQQLVRANLAHNKYAFVVTEMCGETLKSFLERSISFTVFNFKIIRSIMFQIIYTLYVISKVYPTFKHWDLHTENIMLKIYNSGTDGGDILLVYKDLRKGRIWRVPTYGMIAKIIDFGHSEIPEEGIVSIMSQHTGNKFFRTKNDLLLTLYDIYQIMQSRNEGAYIKQLMNEFLKELDPLENHKNFYTPHIRKIEDQIPTYEQMLEVPSFKEYQISERELKNINPKTIFKICTFR